MVRAVCLVLVLAIAVAGASAARVADTLTPADLTWLQSNLRLAANSPVLATLDEAHRNRLHALIARARGGADRKRQAVVSFLTRTVGSSFEETLRRSLRSPPSPVDAMSGR
jgi:hypothetical protein